MHGAELIQEPCEQAAQDLSYELLLHKCSSPPCAEASTLDAGSPRGSSSASTTPSSAGAAPRQSQKQAPRARPAKGSLQLLSNVQAAGADDCVRALVARARELSEAAFGEDCLKEVSKRSKWQLSLLTSGDKDILYGFMVAKVVNGCLSISKLAVDPECRGMGLGRHFMEEVMKAAKKRGDVYDVCLSSLSSAVVFYQRLGFKAFKDLKVAVDFEVEEGQVYMEKRLRQRPRRK